jgi:phthiocerol/phenolphthiocerol synthesis type-I polyketide synthase E
MCHSSPGVTRTAIDITALIKTVLMLKHQAVPSSLHFEPNVDLGLETTPLFVDNNELRLWLRQDAPRHTARQS